MKKTIGILGASVIAMVALAIPTLGSGATQTVRVNEVDGRISLSAKPKGGTVKFVVRNNGDEGHDFWLRGGGKRWKTRVLGVGSSAALTARLKKGVRYSYWCGVSDHASEGMRGSFVAR
jgi:plastocyanin